MRIFSPIIRVDISFLALTGDGAKNLFCWLTHLREFIASLEEDVKYSCVTSQNDTMQVEIQFY